MLFAGGRSLGSVDLRGLGSSKGRAAAAQLFSKVQGLQQNLAHWEPGLRATGVLDRPTVVLINKWMYLETCHNYGGSPYCTPKVRARSMAASDIAANIDNVIASLQMLFARRTPKGVQYGQWANIIEANDPDRDY